jgi:hypothetical protein
MKLKNFTLLAFVGVVILALQSLFYVFSNAGVITFSSDPKMIFTVLNVISFISWVFIALFFYSLYKNQK